MKINGSVEITPQELKEVFERDLIIILGTRPQSMTDDDVKNTTNKAFRKLRIPLEVKSK